MNNIWRKWACFLWQRRNRKALILVNLSESLVESFEVIESSSDLVNLILIVKTQQCRFGLYQVVGDAAREHAFLNIEELRDFGI